MERKTAIVLKWKFEDSFNERVKWIEESKEGTFVHCSSGTEEFINTIVKRLRQANGIIGDLSFGL